MDSSSFAPDFHSRAFLRDGTRVCVRAIRPDDKPRLAAAFARLSPQSVRRRFLHPVTALDAPSLRFLTEVDMSNHVALVLTVGNGDAERLIAVGRFVRATAGDDQAEVGLTVADEYQHRGAGTVLLDLLICIARARGLQALVAHMFTDNSEMLAVLDRSQLPIRQTCEDGVRTVILSLKAAPLDWAPTASIATERRRFADDCHWAGA